MAKRRGALIALVVVLVVAAAAGGVLVVRATSGRSTQQAERLFGPLPPGYRYAELEQDDAEATTDLFRDRTGAADVAARLVGTPEDLAPVGVTVAAFTFRTAPDPRRLAAQLEQDVTLVDPEPKELAGQPVLGHGGDATFSSVTLWVHGRLALLTYGATTAEVDGVMAALLTSGAWRALAA
jgi:hypothetical protein